MGRIFRKQVHGIFHENADGTRRQKIIRDCSEGEELQLVPEPDNPVDPDAVKICRMNGEQIGYWPAEDGEMIEQLRRGWCFRVTIDEIYPMPEGHGKHGICMRVEVLTMAHGKRPEQAPKPTTTGPDAGPDPGRNDLRNGVLACLAILVCGIVWQAVPDGDGYAVLGGMAIVTLIGSAAYFRWKAPRTPVPTSRQGR